LIAKLAKLRLLNEIHITNAILPVPSLKNAHFLQEDKQLLLAYLYMFTEYHPSIAYIAKLLVIKHGHDLTAQDLYTIFSSKCTEKRKSMIYSLFTRSTKIILDIIIPHY
jgi:hypothetical protein